MKKITFSFLFLFSMITAFAQDYKVVDDGSSIKFKLKNFGFNTGGTFSGLQGNIHFEENDPATASFDVSIDANSVNTGIDMRDNHLREEDYFDVKKYPRIHFVSTNVKSTSKQGSFIISGKLTIKDVTKDISFPFTVAQSNADYVFQGEFKINRKDFHVGGSSTVSDNVTITLTVVSKK